MAVLRADVETTFGTWVKLGNCPGCPPPLFQRPWPFLTPCRGYPLPAAGTFYSGGPCVFYLGRPQSSNGTSLVISVLMYKPGPFLTTQSYLGKLTRAILKRKAPCHCGHRTGVVVAASEVGHREAKVWSTQSASPAKAHSRHCPAFSPGRTSQGLGVLISPEGLCFFSQVILETESWKKCDCY